MPQNPTLVFVGKTASGTALPLLVDAKGALVVSSGDQEATTRLNITSATVVKTGAGVLLGLQVTVAGSAAGSANDAATTGGAAASNAIAATPATAGAISLPNGGIPFTNGLVVAPGTGQTIVAICY